MSISRAALAAASVALVVFGTSAKAQQEGQPAPPPPTPVTIETVVRTTVPLPSSLPARVTASRQVEVRARTGGIILERLFEEGASVTQGAPLFKIDRRPLEADVALAEAQLQQAQAQANQAARAQERQEQLARSGTTTQAALDDATSQRQIADASVAQATARVDTAKLSLGYTDVSAPAAGVTSLEQVPEGSLVNSGDLLTRITQLNPAYVTFSASDSEYDDIRRLVESGGAVAPEGVIVTVRFGDGSVYPEKGRIDFTASTVDAATGTVASRAVLSNPASRLLPGQFVRVEIGGVFLKDVITIAPEALLQGPQGTYVYTVGQDDVVAVAPVKVGRDLGKRLVVDSGLNVGDRVITRGLMRVRPGAPVKPEAPVAAASEAPASGGAAQ